MKESEFQKRALRALAGEAPKRGELQQGLLVVFTGQGKGKSTAAFGMGWRCIAHDKKVGVVQFMGGSPLSAEYRTLGQHRLCDFKICCTECKWISSERIDEKKEVVMAWVEAKRMMADPDIAMLILDELSPMVRHGYLNLDTVLTELKARRPELHVVITGQGAPFELMDVADILTEMEMGRHPFPGKKVAAQAGIEF